MDLRKVLNRSSHNRPGLGEEDDNNRSEKERHCEGVGRLSRASTDDSCRGECNSSRFFSHGVTRDENDCASEQKSCGETESARVQTWCARSASLYTGDKTAKRALHDMYCHEQINIVDVHSCFFVRLHFSIGCDNRCKGS